LRRTQYRVADDPAQSCRVARNFIFGKLNNAKQVLDRTRRDHAMRIDEVKFQTASQQFKELMVQVLEETSLDSLRGLEGAGATIYFGLFDDMILRNKESFFFRTRNRRPPLDNVNALLSFVYTMLGSDCASALESVGLDPYVGFLHRDRPGRTSLALDLLEELRPCVADRFVLTLINNGIVTVNDFQHQENGTVLLTPEGRKTIQKEWQTKKQQKITHPFLKEQMEWGLVPYVQALLLARYLRGDLDEYPPFLWK
jgi:CRISPR-associated protein Cas1